MASERINPRYLIALLILLIIVCLPRFDRNDILLEGVVGTDMNNDSMHYVAMAEIYGGKDPDFQPHSPFTYRPFVPYFASLLPIAEMTAINLINIAALFLAIVLMDSLLRNFGLSARQTFSILLIYVVSFPIFYYGPIGYVDPVVIAGLGIGCYLIQNRQEALLIFLIFVSTFVKETIILLIPVYVVHKIISEGASARAGVVSLLLIASYLIGMNLAREISLDATPMFWTPSWDRFMSNAIRFRTWASFVLTLGLPGAAALASILYVLIKKNWSTLLRMLPWIIGFAGAFALFFVSILTAHSDGRFIWPATVFSVIIVGIFISEYRAKMPILDF